MLRSSGKWQAIELGIAIAQLSTFAAGIDWRAVNFLARSWMTNLPFECRKCRVTDVVLNPLRIAFRCFFVDAEAPQERHYNPVPPPTGLRQRLALVGEEYRAVGFPPNKPHVSEPGDVLGDGGRFHSKAFGYVDRTGLSPRLDQLGNQLDVILRHFALMRLTDGCEALRLCFGSPVGSFECFTPM